MKQVLMTASGGVVDEVPAPLIEPGTILVRTSHSCISVGTELSGLRHADTPLWRRALRDPAKAGRAIRGLASEGLGNVRRSLDARASAGTPLGYSASGTVLQVG